MKASKEPTVEELCQAAHNLIAAIERRAIEGDDEAAQGLFSVAGIANARLLPLLSSDGPLMRVAIEQSPALPINLPANPKRQKALLAELVKLGFASKCEFNAAGKLQREKPVTNAAYEIYLCLRRIRENPASSGIRKRAKVMPQVEEWLAWRDANATKLPTRLTRENSREWADLAEPLLGLFYGKEFERHPDFVACGTRATILSLWRQAWKSLANPQA